MADVRRIRREARECALQFLYSLDYSEQPWDERLDPFWQARPIWAEMWGHDGDDSWAVLPQRKGVRSYADRLIKGICGDRETIDAAIGAALENWSPDRVGRIEWNILRIALFEMQRVDDVPDAVAIDEAIEIAKIYGNDETPRFINGVLDRLRDKGRD